MSHVATEGSEISLRELNIAGICLMGRRFGNSVLLVGPLSMLMLPMIRKTSPDSPKVAVSNRAPFRGREV
jgi:hypothetical protein